MLTKLSLRDQVRDHLQKRMLGGKLGSRQRLSLAEIAGALGVSVTPIREALSQLEHAGIVESIPNRGFFIRELSVPEAREIYQVIASLEAMMVAGATYSPRALERLRRAQETLEGEREPERAVRADLAFHERLLEPSSNQLARRIVSELKCRVFYYELEYFDRLAERSVSRHRKILKLLEQGSVERASEEVRKNWVESLDFIEQYFGEDAVANGDPS